MTEEVPLSFSEPEQGVPVTDPGVGASSTNFDEAEASPPTDIPSPAAPIGKSFLITLPTVPDTGSRPTEHGESSSEPSRQFAKKVLKRVLSSWVETLSSGHLVAGFGMVKHVQDILADSEELVWTLQMSGLLLMKSSLQATSGMRPRAFQMMTSSTRCF